MIMSRFGVHWAPGGVAFLHQTGGVQNLISPNLESPFIVRVRPKHLLCPHSIDLGTHLPAPDWIQDPLAAAFLPTPIGVGEKVRLLLDPDRRYEQLVTQLSRLCSPSEPFIRPLWWKQAGQMTPAYGLTNITPMVFIGADTARCRDVFRHIELAQSFGRRVVILTQDRLPVFDAQWITTELSNVSREPLEAIGAGALRRHLLTMQSEQ